MAATKRDSWEQAKKYLAWAKRQGFSKETMLLIPHWHKFHLTRQERRIIRGMIIENFQNKEHDNQD
jgi:hypothetical protein